MRLWDVRSAEDLPYLALVAIACWHMGYSDEETSQRMLGLKEGQIRKVFWALRRSKNRVVRRAVDVGLPHGLTVPLPYGARPVWCGLCKATVNWVPCPACSNRPLRGQVGEVAQRRLILRPEAPTRALPGTMAKMLVFQERLRRGESLFHPKDAQMVT